MPHPPKSFGLASIFHLAKGTPFESLLENHKKEKNFFLNF